MDTNASVSLLKEDLAGRIRVPAAKRLQILEEFDRSGMSGLAFAALVGVKYQTFAGWRRRRSEPPNDHNQGTPSYPYAGPHGSHLSEDLIPNHHIYR